MEAGEREEAAGEAVSDPEVVLLRRISPQFVKRAADGGIRVSGGAFQNTSGTDGMSVALADAVAAEGREVISLLDRYPGFGLVSFTAGFCFEQEQRVERRPEPQEPAHGEVIGEKKPGRRKRFAGAAVWVIELS